MVYQNQPMFINQVTGHRLLHNWLTQNHPLSKPIMLHLHRMLQLLVLLQRPKNATCENIKTRDVNRSLHRLSMVTYIITAYKTARYATATCKLRGFTNRNCEPICFFCSPLYNASKSHPMAPCFRVSIFTLKYYYAPPIPVFY